MAVKTIAILSPGDMGAAVGRALKQHGLDVITSLEGRSARTRDLAADAGIRDVPELADMLRQAELTLSIMVPSEALGTAQRVAGVAAAAGIRGFAYADCNAVSPATATEIGKAIEQGGGRYIDAGIIGSPPGKGAPPRFYVSGPHESVMAELDGKGITVKPMGGPAGRASGIKMVYAALTKGTNALYTSTLIAAENLGLTADLKAELESSQPNMLKSMQGIITLPGKAFRWIGEMEEIADTFEQGGATPLIHRGAADTFRLIADSPLGDERPETVDRSRTLEDTIRVFAVHSKGAAR